MPTPVAIKSGPLTIGDIVLVLFCYTFYILCFYVLLAFFLPACFLNCLCLCYAYLLSRAHRSVFSTFYLTLLYLPLFSPILISLNLILPFLSHILILYHTTPYFTSPYLNLLYRTIHPYTSVSGTTYSVSLPPSSVLVSENFISRVVDANELSALTSCRLGKITQVRSTLLFSLYLLFSLCLRITSSLSLFFQYFFISILFYRCYSIQIPFIHLSFYRFIHLLTYLTDLQENVDPSSAGSYKHATNVQNILREQ